MSAAASVAVSAVSAVPAELVSQKPVLELTAITKSFGGVHALRGASLVIDRPGRVHALLGSNGSGKSTLLGVLAGQLKPDQGTVRVHGEKVSFGSPADAVARRIVMVSQETSVAPDLSVAENILLGRRHARSITGINWKRSYRKAAAVLDTLGVDWPLDAPVRTLRPGQRQMVEIARAVSMEASVVILDEPTSSLTESEVSALFGVIRRLQESGVSIIFVSHRLSEVSTISDEITILRDGQTVSSGPIGEFSHQRVVDEMIGGVDLQAPRSRREEPSAGPVCLRVTDLSVPGLLHQVSLSVRAGEVVGLAGLEGSGRSELLQTIFGVRSSTAGTVSVPSDALPPGEPRAALAHGIGFLPPDRKTDGAVLSMSIEDNICMVKSRDTRRFRGTRSRTDNDVETWMERMSIRAPSRRSLVGDLSGGNQQKVALAKWLVAGREVLLLDEPTRGVDVVAKAQIHNQIVAVAREGSAVLVSSSEYDELQTLCDRVLVMFNGQIVASLSRAEADEATVSRYASGLN